MINGESKGRTRYDPLEDELPDITMAEAGLDVVAVGSAVVPIVGGFFSALAGSASLDRKFGRFREFVFSVRRDLDELADQIDEHYVRSDEFHELFEITLDRIVNERSDARRRYLANLLVNDVRAAGNRADYDTKVRFIRLVAELPTNAFLVLAALGKEPIGKPDLSASFGSYSGELRNRLPTVGDGDIQATLGHLQREGFVREGVSWDGMAPAQATHDLRPLISQTGNELLAFVTDANDRPVIQ